MYTGTPKLCRCRTINQIVYFSVPPLSISFYDTVFTPVIEGQSRQLHCRTDVSYPAGSITWWKNLNGAQSSLVANSQRQKRGPLSGVVLESDVILQARRQDNGAKYWCEVAYTFLNGTKVTRNAPQKPLEIYCE